MKLISVNIENNLHHETVLPFLKKEKADVVCVQELLEEDFTFYKEELNMEGIFQPTSYIKHPIYSQLEGKKAGVAIFTKNLIEAGSIFYHGKEENILKSFAEYISDRKFQKNYALVWVDIKDEQSEIFRFINTHLPVTPEGEVTPYQIEAIDELLRALKPFPEFVLCGDTNAPRNRESFARIAKTYKDNIPPKYQTSMDPNLHRAAKIKPHELADKMVDCLFTTPEYQASSVKLVDGVSDHMAIVAEISRN